MGMRRLQTHVSYTSDQNAKAAGTRGWLLRSCLLGPRYQATEGCSGHMTLSSGPGDGENLEGGQEGHCRRPDGPEETIGAGEKAFSVI